MISNPMKYLATLALMLALTACETGTEKAMILRSPYDGQDLRLVIKGQDAKDALDSSTKIDELLDDFNASPNANLRARINKLLETPGNKIASLGGIQSRAALQAARVTLGAGGNFESMLQTVTVNGQIQESVYGESGFYYVPGDPMHMWVQMITTATRTTPSGNMIIKNWAEMFRIEVPANAVTVETKVPDTGNGVFPDFADVAFPISSVTATGKNFKLWAVGTDVKVTDYWIDDNYDPANGPVYMPSKKYTMAQHPAKFASIFATDDEACIDMMFELNPEHDVSNGGALINGELPPDKDPPYYCLGRCQNPPIINTR